jgi:DNA repair protein RAD7
LDNKVAPDSDHLDSGDEVQVGRTRKVSKAASEKQKIAAKKRAKRRKDDDDDDYEDDEDEYTALSKSLWKSKSNNAKSIGSLEKCAKCSKQFTVVRSWWFVAKILLIMICEDQIHGGR